MDHLTVEQRRKTMQNIKSKDTKPELLLRKRLWKEGVRYRKHSKYVYGKPDVSFKGKKVAIFVDSEFWHGKLYLEGKSIPQANRDFWIEKFERNIQRDKKVNEQLKMEGWNVIRFWENDIYKDLENCISKIMDALKSAK